MTPRLGCTDAELRRIQELLLWSLRTIAELCEQEGIIYFLSDGTALGAHLRAGFIPWDDDVDLGMPRRDYERFVEVAPARLGPELDVQTPATDPWSPFPYCKVRVAGSQFTEYCNRHSRMRTGIYVDVFPWDRTADDLQRQRAHARRVQRWCRLFIYRQTADVTTPPHGPWSWARFGTRGLVHLALRAVPRSFLLARLDGAATALRHADTSHVAGLFSKGVVLHVSELLPLQTVSFEGVPLPAPHRLEEYLRRVYGDIATLPPAAARTGHRPWSLKLPGGRCDDHLR